MLQGFYDTAHPRVLPNQVFFLFDGFKHGLSADLLRGFKDEKSKKLEAAAKIIYCQYDPATLNDRRPIYESTHSGRASPPPELVSANSAGICSAFKPVLLHL